MQSSFETKEKQKNFGKLFSGVSAVALILGVSAGTARAAGTTITNTITSFSVTTASSFDFIDIDGGTVTGNVTNSGNVGPSTGGDPIDPAIQVHSGGNVGGSIINTTLGTITDSETGIAILNATATNDPVGGMIINDGLIKVEGSVSSAFGILITGTAVSSAITNSGAISVALTAIGTGHTVAGILISSTGSLASNVTNNGLISASGTATGTFVSMTAVGVGVTNTTAATGPATVNTITNNTGSLVNVDAVALATGLFATANGTAIGLGQIGIGTSGTANAMTITNAISATVSARAFASVVNATGFASASAIGVGQSAIGGLSISQNVNNSGTINATATALDSGAGPGFFFANATASGIVQTATGSTSITQNITNSGAVNVFAFGRASATSLASSANANASTVFALGLGQFASGTAGTLSNLLTITNTSQGSISVSAVGIGAGTTSPDGRATAVGVSQSAIGAVSNSASLNNAGAINVTASGFASGSTFPTASASATGVFQFVGGGAAISVSATNSGIIDVDALASATGATSPFASANAIGVSQFASATTGTLTNSLSLVNAATGSIDVEATALAFGASNAVALAFATGVFQSAIGGAAISVSATNSGVIDVDALASATGATSPFADAFATGVSQVGIATTGTLTNSLSLVNASTGSIDVEATALAFGASNAEALAVATGVTQFAVGGAAISVSATNSGMIDVDALASATGATSPFASASALGVSQFASTTAGTTSVSISFTNSGTVAVNATAFASGLAGAAATAIALGTGALRLLGGGTGASGTASFNNSGNFSVGAKATATNATTTEVATASAIGYLFAAGAANQTLVISANNSGSLSVNATANGATASAFALAMGVSGASVTGTIANSGTINVTASAPGGSASAIGIGVAANVFNGTIINTGTINVLAIGSTTATAVRFAGSEDFTATNTVTPGTADAATFTNNGGTITAWINSSGTLSHGNAINTVDAPNPVMINLEGGGAITGNILISDDDSILVRNGNTFFDGQINGTKTFVGNLSVASSGTFSLAVGSVSSEANVFVDTYTQTSTGTLAFNITPATTMLGQINANVANLDGTILLNLAPGLYGNTTTFSDVVVANTLNGAWANVTTNTNSAFLNLAAQFPGDGTADLVLTRNAFNSLGGLTQNQNAVAGALENTYSTSLTGPYAALVQDLLFLDANSYQAAVEQLNGAEYAQNLYSNLGSMALLNYSINDRMNAGPIASPNRQNSTLIQRGDVAIWAGAQRVWGEVDGDTEAPGYDQTQTAFYAGIDYAASNNFLIGFVAGYYDNELRFSNGNRKDEDGVQLGLYAAYDTQKFYLRGIGGYASYNADSVRNISFGSTAGTNFGTYDSNVLSFKVETGRRFKIGNDAYFTPYGGISYAKAENDAFTETGLAASALSASSNEAKSFMSDLGARLTAAFAAGQNSKWIVEIGGVWQHEFKDNPINFTTSFAGVPGSSFTVIGSAIDPDTIMLNAGIALATDSGFEVKVSYWGRFNSNFKENSIGLKLIHRF